MGRGNGESIGLLCTKSVLTILNSSHPTTGSWTHCPNINLLNNYSKLCRTGIKFTGKVRTIDVSYVSVKNAFLLLSRCRKGALALISKISSMACTLVFNP